MVLVPLLRRALRGPFADTRRSFAGQVQSTYGGSASLLVAGFAARNVVPRSSMTDWMIARAVSLRGF